MMHFNYVFTKNDYKSFIYERNKQYNIIYFIVATITYCLVMYKLIIDNPVGIGFLFVVYISIIMLFFKFYNKMFTIITVNKNDNKKLKIYGKHKIIVDDDGIYEENLKHEKQISWDDIRRVKITDQYVILYIDYTEAIFFKKEHLKSEAKYKKLIEIIKSKTKG